MAMQDDPHRYDDMLHLPHPVSSARPQMPLADRAAIFSPFAALTGYGSRLEETARLTDAKAALDEHEMELLDQKLQTLRRQAEAHGRPRAEFLCYMPDDRKAGGSFERISGLVKRIDTVARLVVLFAPNGISSGRALPIDDIVDIELR